MNANRLMLGTSTSRMSCPNASRTGRLCIREVGGRFPLGAPGRWCSPAFAFSLLTPLFFLLRQHRDARRQGDDPAVWK
jgi:hypothetical protein